MKIRSSFLLALLASFQMQVFATTENDLTIAVLNNSIPMVINAIDAAAEDSVPLSTMLSYAQGALANTTATQNNNAARRYLYDFSVRPYMDSAAANVIYVDQALFAAVQIGSGYTSIVTQNAPNRIIFGTIQNALNYLGSSGQSLQWSVLINQAVYNENDTVPAGTMVTLKSVGGVILGDALSDEYSSLGANGILTWALNDSLNPSGVTPSLTVQGIPYGSSELTTSCFLGNFLLGGSEAHTTPSFLTQITGTITSSPKLEFDGVWICNGANSLDPGSPDIGPIVMTVRSTRTNGPVGGTGQVSNWTSATVADLETSFVIGGVQCAMLGNVISSGMYCPWTVGQIQSNTLMLDSYYPSGFHPLTFTVTGGLKTFNVNYSSDYWFNINGNAAGTGTTKTVLNE